MTKRGPHLVLLDALIAAGAEDGSGLECQAHDSASGAGLRIVGVADRVGVASAAHCCLTQAFQVRLDLQVAEGLQERGACVLLHSGRGESCNRRDSVTVTAAQWMQ